MPFTTQMLTNALLSTVLPDSVEKTPFAPILLDLSVVLVLQVSVVVLYQDAKVCHRAYA